MARRKSLIRVPFLKFKINRNTIFNIFGFILIGAGLVLLLSFAKNFVPDGGGTALVFINDALVSRFGWLSFFIPFILILVAGHFFNTKRMRFIKPNVSGGIILVFIALLGIIQSGDYGQAIFQNLQSDFTIWGVFIILFITFIIGMVLFLDTSIDLFLLFVFNLVVAMFRFAKKYLLRTFEPKRNFETRLEKQDEKKKDFIHDRKSEEKPKLQIPLPLGNAPAVPQATIPLSPGGITIKPLSQNLKQTWIYPPFSLLNDLMQKEADRGDVNHNANVIEKTLDSFGIRAKVVEVNRGPAITQYALEITQGTRLSRITALSNDLALALAATTGQVRIEAPIPGRSLVGIEIPNIRPELVALKKMLTSPVFAGNNDPLLVPLGLDVSGQPQAASIAKMPHALIAGTTGSGKSVILNAWISTFLFRTKPEDLQMILVDPKRVELSLYNGIPHLLTEVVTDSQKIISALKWTVGEMENRYKEFAKVGARNLEGYNTMEDVTKKPYIIFVIDELADLMMFAPGEAEDLITRIAQMARATGIHLILATQRPSVDIITGLMKANIPTRLAFNVSSMIDSRVIIDMPGAEKLLGKGDMLFMPPDQAKPKRIQGPFLTEKEVNNLVKFLKAQNPEVHYTEEITTQEVSLGGRNGTTVIGVGGEHDALFNQAIEIIMQQDKASASLLQRRLSIGYARAARILDQLEVAGYVGSAEGSKPREVIRRQTQTEEATA